MKDNGNILDEYDRQELVKDLNEFCDKVDCDTKCPLKKNKMCKYGNWELASDESLINAASTIALEYSDENTSDNTEVVIQNYDHNDTETTDNITNPDHYQTNAMECIDEMVVVFGKKAVINFCNLNAWKYRYRSDHKGGKDDLAKADWYLNKSLELQAESDPIQQISVKYEPKYDIYIDGKLQRTVR